MQMRLVIVMIFVLNACATPPVETNSTQAVSWLLYRCLQTHCIDNAPGAQANAEEPGVKQGYFDRCLSTAKAAVGSTEHAKEMDECMADFGYFRTEGDSLIAASNDYPDCDISREFQVSIEEKGSKDQLLITIQGSPCYEASLIVSITSEDGDRLYEYIARFKPHTPTNWEDPNLGEDAKYIAERFADPISFGLTSELPVWMPEADYYEEHYQTIQVSREEYERLRQKSWITYTHLIHYEGWRVLAFDPENQRSIVVSEGTL